MIDIIVDDVVNSTLNAFHGAEIAYLAILGVSALLVGLRCHSITHIFSHALEVLMFSSLVNAAYVIAMPQSAAPQSMAGWMTAFGDKWETLMSFSLEKVLGLYLLAVLALAVAFLLKQLLNRN